MASHLDEKCFIATCNSKRVPKASGMTIPAQSPFEESYRKKTPILLPYHDVKRRIVNALSPLTLTSEAISVDEALGRVSAQSVRSRVNLPSENTSAMDGYAIQSSYSTNASLNRVSFKIKGSVYPEDVGARLRVGPFETSYVATGAPIPRGADAVVRAEDARLVNNHVFIARQVLKGKNIAMKGEDVKLGQPLINKREIITPAKVALLMQCGIRKIRVFKAPRVAILSIGDELALFSEHTKHKVANNYANLIQCYMAELGLQGIILGIAKDDPAEIRGIIENEIKNFDVIITIGGSSVGAKDYTLEALSLEHSEVVFHGVRIVPIRPAGLVVVNGKKPIVVLPSHSITTTLSFFLVALPVLNIISGLEFGSRHLRIRAFAEDQFSNSRYIDALHLVKLQSIENGEYKAKALRWGSNLISTLAEANGFVLLKSKQVIEKEERITVTLFSHSGMYVQ